MTDKNDLHTQQQKKKLTDKEKVDSPDYVHFSAQLPKWLNQKIRIQCITEGKNNSDIIEEVLIKYYKDKEGK